MKLEQQVCSLEFAKKLKELGVKQESLFYWQASKRKMKDYIAEGKWVPRDYSLIPRREGYISDIAGAYGYNRYISAFTVAELGEMLPSSIELGNFDEIFLHCNKMRGEIWEVEYSWYETVHKYFEDKSEADARAKMLIYLIENKLITL